MKKILAVVFLLAFASASFAASVFNYSNAGGSSLLSGAAVFSNSASLGFLSYAGNSSTVLRWTPDYSLGDLSMGLTVNMPLTNTTNPYIDTIVFRYLEYKNPTWGMRYGVVSDYTVGSGLLVNHYSTNSQGAIIQNDQQSGVTGYYNYGMFSFKYLGTWSRVYCVRISEQPTSALNIEQYFVTDFDGVSYVKPDGTQVQYPGQSGYGIDADYSLWGGIKLYAEYAKMNNHGSGFTAGLGADYDLMIAKAGFKAEKRMIDKNFVPGYFDMDYETNPVDMASYEASSTNKDGYLFSTYLNVLNMAAAWAQLEGYNNSNPALKAEANAAIMDAYTVAAGFYQPNFVDARSLDITQGAVITGRVGYKVNPFTTMYVNYKKAYDGVLGQVVESQWYEVSLSF